MSEIISPGLKLAEESHVVVPKIKYGQLEFTSFKVKRSIGPKMYSELEQALVPLRELALTMKDVRFNFESFTLRKLERECFTYVYFCRITEEAPSLPEIEMKINVLGYFYFRRNN